MATTFQIDVGIPLPPARQSGRAEALRALREAPPGSSIFFPGIKVNSVSSSLHFLGGETDMFVSRTVEGGVRVWRVG